MVRRLFAVGTGVAMLGATAMGATAAVDLRDYPNMFVTDGVFNGFLVVGENAKPIDNLAMTDIAASMKVAKTSGTSAVAITGDAWKVATSSKKYEMSNSNATASLIVGESLRDINTFIGDEELGALKDGVWATNQQNYGYQQFMFFDADAAAYSTNNIVKYAENDQDVTADHFFIASARQIARYRLEFTSTAQSDVTDSAGSPTTSGTYLDDFQDTTLTILGQEYSVVQARRPGATPEDTVKLILMSGSTKDTLLEGETKTYNIKGKAYDVTLSFVDSTSAKFTVNGEVTNKLKDGDTYVLSDKSEIGVSEVLYQAYAGGIHSSTFFVGAKKLEMRHNNVTGGDTASGTQLKASSEDVDGTNVIISGTDDNTTFTISAINLNMTADDDYFIGAGQKLSDVIAASGDEKEILVAGGFDMEYKGLTEEKTKDLRLKTSSSRRYKLALFDGDGNAVDIPVTFAEGNTNLSLGEEAWTGTRATQKRLNIVEATGSDVLAGAQRLDDNIAKDDFFILTAGSALDGSAKSYLLQYKGSDRQTKTSPKIRFKNLGNGETLEYSVTAVSAGATGTIATLKVGGYSFLVQNASGMEVDDFQVDVDQDASGAIGTGVFVNFVDYYGSEWMFDEVRVNNSNATGTVEGASADSITIKMGTPNGDDYDNVRPMNLTLNITASSDPEVRAALGANEPGITGGNPTFLTPDGQSEVSYGWTSMGSFVTFQSPAGEPQELTIQYPEKQRLPQLYVTSGAITSSMKAAGDMVAVQVVDATKLDSEIADMTAQNLIVVGGPCVNTIAAELLGNPADCTVGFTPGKARVKLFEHANGNVAMLVAGYSGADTRLAGKVVANRASELAGMEVEVEGTTSADATISVPIAK